MLDLTAAWDLCAAGQWLPAAPCCSHAQLLQHELRFDFLPFCKSILLTCVAGAGPACPESPCSMVGLLSWWYS